MRPTIVYLHPHFTMRAGATNFVLDTATGLQERGWPVVIVTGQVDREIVGSRPLGIIELGGPLPSDPRHWLGLGWLIRRLFAELDRISPKILFPQVLPANYWAFMYRVARPWVPCVWMCQEPSAFVHSWANIRSLSGPMRLATIAANPALQIADRLLATQADAIIANSHFTAAAIRRIYNRDCDAIAYPPVRPDAFTGSHRKRDCILSLGRLTRFKRVDVLVRGFADAFKKLGETLPPLVIAGVGPEGAALRTLVAELGLERRICFAGEVNDDERRALYARALLFVATAPNEPFGLTGVEAMAAGAPVLAPDQGGSAEIVADGETGAVYRAGDANDLARKLAELAPDTERLAGMGEAARQRAQIHFSLSRTVGCLDNVMHTLCKA